MDEQPTERSQVDNCPFNPDVAAQLRIRILHATAPGPPDAANRIKNTQLPAHARDLSWAVTCFIRVMICFPLN